MIVDAIVPPFSEPLFMETSSKRCEVLPEPIVDRPLFGSQQRNARDLLGLLRRAGVRCDEEADGKYNRDSDQPHRALETPDRGPPRPLISRTSTRYGRPRQPSWRGRPR